MVNVNRIKVIFMTFRNASGVVGRKKNNLRRSTTLSLIGLERLVNVSITSMAVAAKER
jgi:hypothetical protein